MLPAQMRGGRVHVKTVRVARVAVPEEAIRAALTADEIAQEAEFFSFGTNDLTQMTLLQPRRRWQVPEGATGMKVAESYLYLTNLGITVDMNG